MILHAAALAVLFVNEVSPAPVVVQCTTSAGQDPLWARLLVISIPSILALGIAWMAFRWNSQKDQQRWTLDNKKAEWQNLLKFASAIEQFMPSVAIGGELISAVNDPSFNQHLREMTRAVLSCVFISETRMNGIYQRLCDIQITNDKSKGYIEAHNQNAHVAHSQGIPGKLDAAKNVQSELGALWREIRRFATEDMELDRRRPWSKSWADLLKRAHGSQAKVSSPSGAAE
jgi:hypothetical protein